MLGPELKDLRSGDLRKALKKDDALVRRVVRDAAVATDIVVGNMVNLLNPQVIALGGGVMSRCAQPATDRQRPRGVRISRPVCRRNGSITSSSMSRCSASTAASVSTPTGPPA